MMGFFIGLVVGGAVGVFASALCVVTGNIDACKTAYDKGYEKGKDDGWKTTCMRLRTDCPAYERFIERGE